MEFGGGGDALSPTLRQLGLDVSYYKGGVRHRLDEAQVGKYYSRQRAKVRSRLDEAQLQSAQAPEAPAAPAALSLTDGSEPRAEDECVVCLEAARSALLVPCGHTSMCTDCAKKLDPMVCVECRRPIEKILPWNQLTASRRVLLA